MTSAQSGRIRAATDGTEQRGGPMPRHWRNRWRASAGLRAQQGDIVGSRRLYERALHLVRVNDGLYSERQVPILRQLFDSTAAAAI